jgi:hypothetical protein
MAEAWKRKNKWKNNEELQYGIVLNTCYRNNQLDSSTSFSYNFPEPLTNITSMKLSAIELPVDSYFTISKFQNNNVFYITDNNYEVIIPDGNYNDNDTMVTAINSAIFNTWNDISDNNPTELFEDTSTDSSCSLYAEDVNHYTIAFYNTATIEDISINFSTVKSDPKFVESLGWILGYRRSQVNIRADNSLNAEAILSIAPTKSFLFCVDDFTGRYIDNIKVATASSFLNKPVLGRIPFIRTTDNLKTFVFNKFNDTPANIRLYNGPITIQKIKVEILDDLGRLITLNNTDYNFVLTFTKSTLE